MKKMAVAILAVAILMVGLSVLINYHGVEAGTSEGATYVPNKKCKTCHPKPFKQQAETYHAKSFENLTSAGEDTNPECLPCHTTGYGKPGGFTDIASTEDLAGTTCQACHGPGSLHIKAKKEDRAKTIEKTPKAACTKCHKTHEDHPDIGSKSLPSLQKKLERIKARISEAGG
jgi:hypothetical protein